jgi:hypothetical protein
VLFSNDMFPLNLYHNEDIVIEDQRKGEIYASECDKTRPLPGNGIDQRELTNMYIQAAISFVEKNDDAPFFSTCRTHFPMYATTPQPNSQIHHGEAPKATWSKTWTEVPMIVRWPSEIQSGRVTDEMAMNSDLYPTLLNFAQLPLPQDRIIDGRDITGLLKLMMCKTCIPSNQD